MQASPVAALVLAFLPLTLAAEQPSAPQSDFGPYLVADFENPHEALLLTLAGSPIPKIWIESKDPVLLKAILERLNQTKNRGVSVTVHFPQPVQISSDLSWLKVVLPESSVTLSDPRSFAPQAEYSATSSLVTRFLTQFQSDIQALSATYPQLAWIKDAKLSRPAASPDISQNLEYERGVTRKEMILGPNEPAPASTERLILSENAVQFYAIVTDRSPHREITGYRRASNGVHRLSFSYHLEIPGLSDEARAAVQTAFDQAIAQLPKHGFELIALTKGI